MVESPGLVISITGHRDLPEDDPALREVVRGQIEHLRRRAGNVPLTLLSCLAEGADRLVAEVALREFGASLVAPLPFAPRDYEQDFVDTRSRLAFHMYLDECERWFVVDHGDGTSRERSWYYACAGAYLVSKCEVLIAIWDGQPARGPGGTGELVDWVRAGRVPEIYRACAGAESSPARSVVHINPGRHSVSQWRREF